MTLRPRDDIPVLDLLTPLVRRWKFMLFLPTSAAVVTAVYSVVTPAVFTASVTFTPEATVGSAPPGSLAGLAGLAGQFGLSGLSGSTVSPDFFASVLRSRELLTATLDSDFPSPGGDRPEPSKLLDLLHIRATSEDARRAEGVRRLAELTATAVDRRTGIVTLTVRMRDPSLSAAVANRMVQLLNQFNLEQRRSQSREQKRFAGARLQAAEAELRTAESDLLLFLQNNRTYRGSPLLEYEYDRLQRRVQAKQEVFLSLTKAYEDARIAEVRDTPVLTIVDRAVPPVRRTWPRRKLMVIVAAFAGFATAAALAYAGHTRESIVRSAPPEYHAFREAVAEARRQLRHLLRRSPSAG